MEENELMDGWMDGSVGECKDGLMGGWMDGWLRWI